MDRSKRRAPGTPPTVPEHTVVRPRLLAPLRRRFEVPVTAVIAGAGYGKTTLLAQAIAENLLDPMGTDVWVTLTSLDRHPDRFLADLSGAITENTEAVTSIGAIVDLLVVRAPESVAIVLDDLHLLDGSAGGDLVAELAHLLPTNGHLVLGSRTVPRVGLRRLQAAGGALVLDEPALRFTATELAELAAVTDVDPSLVADLPPWPALAVLSSTVGHEASMEFVWEEILDGVEADRREALAIAARFDDLDDDLAAALTDGRWSAGELVAGLPLVDRIDHRFRLHDLWKVALRAGVAPEAAGPKLCAAADLLLARGDLVPALTALRDAGATDRLLAEARRFASASVSAGLNRADAEQVLALLPRSEREGALGAALRAIIGWNDDLERHLAELLALSTEAGDDELRALAYWRLTQRQGTIDPEQMAVPAELLSLADDGWPLARASVALVRSHEGERRGDVDAALSVLHEFDAPDPRTRRSAVDSRLVALGRPEMVGETLEEVLADGVSEPVAAQAVWLRGDIDPDVAWPIAATLPNAYGHRRMVDVQVPLLGIVTSVALAAGATAEARSLADEALHLADRTIPGLRLFAGVADALTALCESGEEVAAERFAALVDARPLTPWPPWAYLGALAPFRALVPGADALDALDLGPSLGVAVRAGRMIADLRAGSPPTITTDLPWHDVDLMRVQVPPPLLCELAVAAAATDPAAAAVLARIPDRSRHVRRLLDHPNPAMRRTARAMAADEPVRPDHDLRLVTMGDLRAERSDGVSIERLDGRARLRQLLALLVLERSLPRAEAAARMWPELAPEAAANNLRVTLHKLSAVLEPERPAGEAWWVRSTGDRLALASEGLTVDLDRFDAHLHDARQAEQQGAPSVAARHYGAMVELYGGELLPGVDDPAIEPERTRVRALAYNAACRQAELRLAQGEPEEALEHAVTATRLDPLAERAGRLLVACHLAVGAHSAARTSARALLHRLGAEGVEPEAETAALTDRLC